MSQTLHGEKWAELTVNNKSKKITDANMIEQSTELKGYIYYVYKFGCGFIHYQTFIIMKLITLLTNLITQSSLT
jgi:hypothetical protein